MQFHCNFYYVPNLHHVLMELCETKVNFCRFTIQLSKTESDFEIEKNLILLFTLSCYYAGSIYVKK